MLLLSVCLGRTYTRKYNNMPLAIVCRRCLSVSGPALLLHCTYSTDMRLAILCGRFDLRRRAKHAKSLLEGEQRRALTL